MLKDYIRALQTSFTTVTGLRDVLVKVFKGVDEALEGAITVKDYELSVLTGTADTSRENSCKVINGVCYIQINATGVTATANDTVIATIPSGVISKSVIATVTCGGANTIEIKPNGEITLGTTVSSKSLRVVTSFTI